jgi:rare lipoprotein A
MITESISTNCSKVPGIPNANDLVPKRLHAGAGMKGVSSVGAILLAFLFAACGSRNVQPASSSYRSQTYVGSRGRDSHKRESALSSHVVASWYGPGYEGRRTANGERFDPNSFSAASRTLPLGSIVRVTNLRNGRSVEVRINDRGPVAPGRSIDLSPAAARKIGLTNKGIDHVRITRISD